MTETVRNNRARHRYELVADGHVAEAHYELSGGVITFVHTEVPKALEGRGIGSRLVKGALEGARADGLKVAAECPFVKAYLERHAADYADLVQR